jgi:cytochrome c oxidase subunit 3
MAAHANGTVEGLRVDHHFANADQQYQSAKLGMWLFLATEILFFGGLFCAYAVYRANHPEIFVFGHHFLDKNLGALNTVILICSSFTIAWAVRAAQLRQMKILKLMLWLTIACAVGFLSVKYVEYSHKWHDGLLWASRYNPQAAHGGHAEDVPGETVVEAAGQAGSASMSIGASAAAAAPVPGGDPPAAVERSTIAAAASGPAGLAEPAVAAADEDTIVAEPANARVYFSIYFLMTGLHGIHVLGGIGAMLWLLWGVRQGIFASGHFTRVDLVALYWHVVDLVWIYLFLLLYLID